MNTAKTMRIKEYKEISVGDKVTIISTGKTAPVLGIFIKLCNGGDKVHVKLKGVIGRIPYNRVTKL